MRSFFVHLTNFSFNSEKRKEQGVPKQSSIHLGGASRMENILVVGKGEAFLSFVKNLTTFNFQRKEINDSFAYYQRKDDGSNKNKEGMFHINLHKLEMEKSLLMDYNSIFLFPDEMKEKMEIVVFFSELSTGNIFVITHTMRHLKIYKHLGANYVIVSKPGSNRLNWIINNF